MRCLLTSWGSRGDLHPFLALGRVLLARGHAVTLVGHPEWASETEAACLRFVSTGEPPRTNFLQLHPEVLSTRWGGLPGLRALVKEGIEPSLEPMFAALLGEIDQHDVLVAHHFVFSARATAEVSGKPLVSVFLAPGVIPSAYSRPGPHHGRGGVGAFARAMNRLIWQGGRMATERFVDPVVNQFRARHGLAPVRGAVLDAASDFLNLQLYSGHFAPSPPDWPAGRQPSGFCFHDPPGPASLPPQVEAFLSRGERPVLFTLGSAAVQLPGGFYREAAEALSALRLRGILLIGPEENRPPALPDEVLALNYAPYGLLMPHVRAVVHQCGIGTLSHALRAGVPSVACPFAFDQPNNARRLEALGVAEMILPGKRNARAIGRALERLLAGAASIRAQRLGEQIRVEDGAGRACEILERRFGGAG